MFFVHKDNPIESLTAEQIKGIYSGRITNWKDVGGKDEKIEAFQRNEGSGSQSKVDKKIIPVTAGAEISFLNVKMQVAVNNQIEFVECKVNLQQAKKLKKKFLDGTLNEDEIFKILSVDETGATMSIDYSKLRKYFPANYTRKQCENALWDILEEWKERNCA